MGMTFQIGDQNFTAIQNASGKYAMNMKVNAPRMKKDRFHVPGTNGNYVIRHGWTGRQITCTMVYVGKKEDVNAAIADDRDVWGNASLTIIGWDGLEYLGCNLENFTPTGSPMGFRNNADTETWIIWEVEAIFEQDILTNPT
jgi:hypothetical protein